MSGRILLTGATGFAGPALLSSLRSIGSASVSLAGRDRTGVKIQDGEHWHEISRLDAETRWDEALAGIHTVVHAAGRAHVQDIDPVHGLAEFRQVNTEATTHLARRAAAAGVRRFVFLSSIKVNGEATYEAPFAEADLPKPEGGYAVSKWEAECALREIAQQSGMEFVILRPPLVYGPGVKANMLNLAKAVRRHLPLPFGAIHNVRSLIGLGNLADVVARCVLHPAAGNQLFLVTDGEDLSTPELVRRLAQAMRTKPLLLPVPVSLLAFGARLAGRQATFDRLCGNLQIDSSHVRRTLDWKPPFSIDEEMAKLAAALPDEGEMAQ